MQVRLIKVEISKLSHLVSINVNGFIIIKGLIQQSDLILWLITDCFVKNFYDDEPFYGMDQY
jgi:hypothetical protein